MKIKSILSFLLVAVLLFTCLTGVITVSADTENGFIYTLSDEGATVTGLEKGYSTTSLTVPDTLGGKAVVAIGEKAFFQCNTAKITLPDTVTTIGDSAFAYSEITEIKMPANLLTVGNSAFYSCEKLEGVSIPDTVTTIGEKAFAYCDVLKTANLPASLTKLGESVFATDPVLASHITIPDGITEIPQGTFYGCYKLAGVTFHEGVVAIHNEAFKNCDAITAIVLPLGLQEINYDAFANCDSLSEVTLGDQLKDYGISNPFGSSPIKTVHIAEGSTVVNSDLIKYVTGLETITLPDTVTEIGEKAFMSCDALKSVILPDGVTTIGDSAFRYCKELGEVFIPDSVTDIGKEILDETRLSLTTSNWTDGVLYVGNHLIDVDTKYEGELILRDGLLNIASGAFDGCNGITVLCLPASLKSVNDEAFSNGYYPFGAVEYDGNQDEWEKIAVGMSNPQLTDQNLIYKTGGSYGDVNDDKKVDANDALIVLKAVVGKVELTTRQGLVADVDVSEKADATDALAILKKVVGKVKQFPAEVPGLRMNMIYEAVIIPEDAQGKLDVVQLEFISETEVGFEHIGYDSDENLACDDAIEIDGVTYYAVTGMGGCGTYAIDKNEIVIYYGGEEEFWRLQFQENGDLLCTSSNGAEIAVNSQFQLAR